ncbi:hypothetical protein [Kineococcus sp. SYSU DK003]|uniref:hypothetical protein n=1 Tax=Kineococcus sp. SYSU DK003 TaxID=3383124 RepID=UPI003D7C8B78
MAHRPSTAPRVARRFGVHLRPHVMALCGFFAGRIGWWCVVVGTWLLVAPSGTATEQPVRPLGDAGAAVDGLVVDPPVPAGVEVRTMPTSDPVLVLHPGSWLERGLAHGQTPLVWLCVGAAALWLAPLLRSFAAGEPFDRGNPRRLRGIAAAVLVAGHVAPWLPVLATELALRRLGMTGDWSPSRGLPVHTSLLFALLLLLLAGALRQGRTLQDDVEGLV